jgi:type I restriction enzyme, R subunit
VLAKHSKSFSLIDCISVGVDRMINLFGRDTIFAAGDEELDEDATKLDIPIHAFDLVIADECYRGYTSSEESIWRKTLDHFDAVKIGLTATPATHSTRPRPC